MLHRPDSRISKVEYPVGLGGEMKTWNIDNNDGSSSYLVRPQAYKDVSSDPRKGFQSVFAYGKRSAERDAYRQAHMTPGGTPGVVNLGVLDSYGKPIPFTPFEWNGRQMLTDAKGMIKYIEKDYFQNAISLENERVKYVTQMISLVVGQPAESVIAIFGYDFYVALAGDENNTTAQAVFAQNLYKSYLRTAGFSDEIIKRKLFVFTRYSDAEASPEVMCNYGDNDPEWSRAFNKLSMLIEYHPAAILFDSGSLNPLESSGTMHGDMGNSNKGPMSPEAEGRMNVMASAGIKANIDANRDKGVPFVDLTKK